MEWGRGGRRRKDKEGGGWRAEILEHNFMQNPKDGMIQLCTDQAHEPCHSSDLPGAVPITTSHGELISCSVPGDPPSLSLPWQPVPTMVVTAWVQRLI